MFRLPLSVLFIVSHVPIYVLAIMTSEEERYWKALKASPLPHVQYDPDDVHDNSSSLMDALEQYDMLSSKELRKLMISVDRRDFTPPNRNPYHDIPCLLENCSYLSSPSFIASSLGAAITKLKPGDTVLDVGTGSGYTAALLGYMVGPTGKVYSLDHMQYLVDKAQENIRKNHAHLLDDAIVNIKCGDARKGYPGTGPYDLVYLGGKVSNPHAKQFLKLVKPGGRLIISLKNDDIDVLDNLYYVDRHLNNKTTVKFIRQHSEDHSNIWDIGSHKLLIQDFNENVRPMWDHTTFIPYLNPIGTKTPLIVESAYNERRKFEHSQLWSNKHGHKAYSWTPIDFTHLNTDLWTLYRTGTFGTDVFPYPDSYVFDLSQ